MLFIEALLFIIEWPLRIFFYNKQIIRKNISELETNPNKPGGPLIIYLNTNLNTSSVNIACPPRKYIGITLKNYDMKPADEYVKPTYNKQISIKNDDVLYNWIIAQKSLILIFGDHNEIVYIYLSKKTSSVFIIKFYLKWLFNNF